MSAIAAFGKMALESLAGGIGCPLIPEWRLEVVAGASTIHERICALQSELSVRALYEEAPSYIFALTELPSLGFEVSGLFPVARDEAARVIEFDAVMVRAASLP